MRTGDSIKVRRDKGFIRLNYVHRLNYETGCIYRDYTMCITTLQGGVFGTGFGFPLEGQYLKSDLKNCKILLTEKSLNYFIESIY